MSENTRLNIAVLDPGERHATYSYQMAKVVQKELEKWAKNLSFSLAVTIVSCINHQQVVEVLKQKNTVILQPISNSSTGLVPPSAYSPFTEVMHKEGLETLGGVDLLIENYLISKKPELFEEENYQSIEYVLTHPAPLPQCSEIIEKIKLAHKKAGTECKIVTNFASTSLAVESLNSAEYSGTNTVAIGNLQSATYFDLSHSKTPVQTYKDNYTTFLIASGKEMLDEKLKQTIAKFIEKKANKSTVNFIIKTTIGNEVGSLEQFLSELYNQFCINLNYIQVDSTDLKAAPYFSGEVPVDKLEALKTFLQNMIAPGDFYITFPHLVIDPESEAKKDVYISTEKDSKIVIEIENIEKGAEKYVTANIPNRAGSLIEALELIRQAGINLSEIQVFARGNEHSAELVGKGTREKAS